MKYSADILDDVVVKEVFMSKIVLESAAASWQKLVLEAEARCQMPLNEDLESYLVFLLMRHTEKPEITSNIMAMDYLESLAANGQNQQDKLRDVGDQCLIFSGLFPKIAERRLVKISYYANIGVSAYHSLADTCRTQLQEFYHLLAEEFVRLMDILQVIRTMNSANEALSPIEAIELWGDTGSKQAFTSAQEVSDSAICLDTSVYKH